MPFTIDVATTDASNASRPSGMFVALNIFLYDLKGRIDITYYSSQTDFDDKKTAIAMPNEGANVYPTFLTATLTPANYLADIHTGVHAVVKSALEAVPEIGVGNVTEVNYN